jgi:hypothetical protein
VVGFDGDVLFEEGEDLASRAAALGGQGAAGELLVVLVGPGEAATWAIQVLWPASLAPEKSMP